MSLKPRQADGLREVMGQITADMTEYLLQDAARRIAEAGKMTSTAAYELYRSEALGAGQRALKKELKKLLRLSNRQIRRLFRQAARFSRDNDCAAAGVWASEAQEESLARMTFAAIRLAEQDFTNLTQTLGMVAPDGKVYPMRSFYRKTMDYAFEQVFTGAADYQTAIRQATAKMAEKGVLTIDYESGVHTSLEAAVRRNMMGGIGLLDEQITRADHDAFGCNGWEISAHAASAPDHEPIQGRQYSDAEYARLNGSLKRRIGTLNCGHVAFPILLGVNAPQYSEQELEAFRQDNARGISYEGRHYTKYEATQKQRALERAQRLQKRRFLTAEATGDTEAAQVAATHLQALRGQYRRFSKAAGLRTQAERIEVSGFGRSAAGKATAAAQKRHEEWIKSINAQDSEFKSLAKYYEEKYNSSPAYQLFRQYATDVESGWISPLSGFSNYRHLYNRIQKEIVGKTAADGTVITGQVPHFMQRVIGTLVDPKKLKDDLQIIRRSGVSIEDIKEALFFPQKTGKILLRKNGNRSMKLYGSNCTVAINPDTGMLIQTNPRGSE